MVNPVRMAKNRVINGSQDEAYNMYNEYNGTLTHKQWSGIRRRGFVAWLLTQNLRTTTFQDTVKTVVRVVKIRSVISCSVSHVILVHDFCHLVWRKHMVRFYQVCNILPTGRLYPPTTAWVYPYERIQIVPFSVDKP